MHGLGPSSKLPPGGGALGGIAGGLGGDQLWETFLEPAIGRAAKLSGVQFTPGPDEVLDLVEESYKTELRTRRDPGLKSLVACSARSLLCLLLGITPRLF